MLEVRLIGRFEVRWESKTVTLSTRAAQSLFAYLILTAGTLHRREKLAGMLWPEESDQKARTFLRNELWRIRKALTPTANVEHLIADNLTVGFNPSSAYQLDAAAVQNLNDTAPADELINALSNYHGELLPGFYEDWVVLEREHLQVLFEQKIARLLEMLEKDQRWNDILEWAERWISLAQAPEAAYRALMVAYDALGDHAKVASTFERCKKALRQLDLEPSEETHALAFKRNSKIKIPIPLTSFIGREKELKEVADLFSKSRLITLTGSGGVGKTRLAIQVVAEVMDLFPDGVWFLDLALLSDPSLVPNTLASLLGLRESGEISVTDLLSNYFRTRTALVIFDNCEHLIESCAQLINLLLTSCEDVAVLATSREILRVSGELPYRVPSLVVPSSDLQFTVNDLANMESVRLFTERATLISPDFVFNSQNAFDIARICQRLDGIPLAIELAAARTNLLSMQQILTGLDNRFHLLTHGLRSALPRHQTLLAMIEWSYDLLSEKERLLFRRLAVFVGGWTLEAAEEVCSGNDIESNEVLDILTQLVEKSLILIDVRQGQKRYRRLETIRQFARQKMFETIEVTSLSRNHAVYYSKMDTIPGDELDNIRSVFRWCLNSREAKPALRLSSDFFFWENRVVEGLHLITQILALPETQESTQERGRALYSAFALSFFNRNYPAARTFLVELLELNHTLNDATLIWAQKFATAMIIAAEGNYEEAYDMYLEIKAHPPDPFRSAMSTLGMASCALMLHNLDKAREHTEDAQQQFDELNTKNYLIDCDLILGYIALEEDNPGTARKHFEKGIWAAVSNFAQQRLGLIYAGLAGVALQQGNLYEAAQWFGIAEMTISTTGYYARFFPDVISQGYLAQVKSLLDPHTFRAAWEEGRAMTIEQAIDYALHQLK
jgi:predicted ATPase/DNA-binding SARP family transcriptional activator